MQWCFRLNPKAIFLVLTSHMFEAEEFKSIPWDARSNSRSQWIPLDYFLPYALTNFIHFLNYSYHSKTYLFTSHFSLLNEKKTFVFCLLDTSTWDQGRDLVGKTVEPWFPRQEWETKQADHFHRQEHGKSLEISLFCNVILNCVGASKEWGLKIKSEA